MNAIRLRLAAIGLVGSMAAQAALAGSFSVSPVRVTLSAGEPIAALTVHNSGDEPAVVQLSAMGWRQQDGVDRYEPTRELLATPPIFTVAPRSSQVVRVGLRRGVDPRRELTYRLYLQEVLAPPPPDFAGARVALRFGVPVFVTPAVKPVQSLEWALRRTAGGALSLVCMNSGTAHVRIASFALAGDGATDTIEGMALKVASDLHAGQQREWALPVQAAAAAGAAWHLSAVTGKGDVRAELIVP